MRQPFTSAANTARSRRIVFFFYLFFVFSKNDNHCEEWRHAVPIMCFGYCRTSDIVCGQLVNSFRFDFGYRNRFTQILSLCERRKMLINWIPIEMVAIEFREHFLLFVCPKCDRRSAAKHLVLFCKQIIFRLGLATRKFEWFRRLFEMISQAAAKNKKQTINTFNLNRVYDNLV